MSDSPRTDALEKAQWDNSVSDGYVACLVLARQLERELAEARNSVLELEGALRIERALQSAAPTDESSKS